MTSFSGLSALACQWSGLVLNVIEMPIDFRHTKPAVIEGDWCFQVCRDEVHKDQVPDLPYLNATTWASHEFLHNPTAHDPPSTGTMTCPAVKLQVIQHSS